MHASSVVIADGAQHPSDINLVIADGAQHLPDTNPVIPDGAQPSASVIPDGMQHLSDTNFVVPDGASHFMNVIPDGAQRRAGIPVSAAHAPLQRRQRDDDEGRGRFDGSADDALPGAGR